MRDHLLDLVGHTQDLEIELVKITGTQEKTSVTAISQDQAVVVMAEFNQPIDEFMGTFGMPNLSKLKVLLNLEEYREEAKTTIERRENGSPESINFENAAGDFRNSYRFMVESIVNVKLKTPQFKGVNWHVEFEPTVASIQRLKMQAQANAEEANFQIKTDKHDLKMFFGDHSTHAGEFVFHSGVKGTVKRAWAYPIKTFTKILDFVGDKVIRISDDGAAQITVDSGLAVYNYILPAQSK
jgi:hypothetical protein